jgi:hypothetical protein
LRKNGKICPGHVIGFAPPGRKEAAKDEKRKPETGFKSLSQHFLKQNRS